MQRPRARARVSSSSSRRDLPAPASPEIDRELAFAVDGLVQASLQLSPSRSFARRTARASGRGMATERVAIIGLTCSLSFRLERTACRACGDFPRLLRAFLRLLGQALHHDRLERLRRSPHRARAVTAAARGRPGTVRTATRR